jgi:glutamate 5-kinase
MTERRILRKAKHIVLKVGSKALASSSGGTIEALATQIAEAKRAGRFVTLVSSGAIALGVKKLGYKSRPKEIAKLQAAAAAGQSQLMRAYEDAFEREGLLPAQVLLTHADLADRTRSNNARAALAALLSQGAVPVLNENDSVAVEEIKFGDNDQLSSLVVPLVDADLLVLLSDIPGLLDKAGKRVSVIHDVDAEAVPLLRSTKSDVGTGGMQSKLDAAKRANLAGCHVVIADARCSDSLSRILAGEDIGTLFLAKGPRISAKKHWIAFTLRTKGVLILDEGCESAVRKRNASVLAIGVRGVRGDFLAGDAVVLQNRDGAELGRGLALLSSAECARAASVSKMVLVHHDELVVWPSSGQG